MTTKNNRKTVGWNGASCFVQQSMYQIDPSIVFVRIWNRTERSCNWEDGLCLFPITMKNEMPSFKVGRFFRCHQKQVIPQLVRNAWGVRALSPCWTVKAIIGCQLGWRSLPRLVHECLLHFSWGEYNAHNALFQSGATTLAGKSCLGGREAARLARKGHGEPTFAAPELPVQD